MSTSCSPAYTGRLPPTTCKLLQQPATIIEEAGIFHHGSSALFKRPSIKRTSKWRSLLAHLSPPLLLSTPFTSTKPRHSSHTQLVPSSTPSALPCDIPCGISPPPHTSAIPSLPLTAAAAAAATETPVPDAQNNHLTSCNSSPLNYTEAANNDVEQLLHLLLEPSIINTRMCTLNALCTLSANSPDRFVAAGGIEIILKILNRTTQIHQQSHPTATIVEETEKALLLLQLSTSNSKDGCAAALQHCDSIISLLGKKLLRVSETCTASTIAILTALCRHPESSAALFRKAMSETAIPSKLVVVLQVASKDSTKRRAGGLLRILLGEEQQQRQQITREAQF